MSFFRVTTVSADVSIADLGISLVHPTTNFIISNQFNFEELSISKDLESAVISGVITAQVLLDSGWTSITAASFTLDELYATYADIYQLVVSRQSSELVSGNDTSTHKHDNMYYTETELSATSGGTKIGVDPTGFTNLSGVNVQTMFASVEAALVAMDLDAVYAHDTDGILNVNGVSKNLKLRSNNINQIFIDRQTGSDVQNFLKTDVGANELLLGALATGLLAQINTRVLGNLIIDGNLTWTGTLTDQTVNNMNVTNQRITLLEGAVANQDAFVAVHRPTGINSVLKWNETLTRWQSGIEGSEKTIALLNNSEVVVGVWEMQGGSATDPNMYLTNKAAASTTNLGSASQIPVEMIGNILAFYDKTRTKTLSVHRMYLPFTGRDSANNTNEYARLASAFTSNQSSARLINDMTLIGMSIQTTGAETWTARVRKNGVATNLASLVAVTQSGVQSATVNIDFNAGDKIDVYIDGTSIDRPVITLEFAQRF